MERLFNGLCNRSTSINWLKKRQLQLHFSYCLLAYKDSPLQTVKITFNALRFAEVIINVVVYHHELSNSIVTNKCSLFTSKFWLSLCYFLSIKRRLSTTFHPQTDSQTERQNSTIEAYLQAFVNFEQNDWAKLLLIAKFAYNNAKNLSTSYASFELNYSYHPRVCFEKNTNPHSQSKSADKLSADLQDLMTVCQENLYHV